MHSDGIWNILELQWKKNINLYKPCIQTVFETIWNCKENLENINYLQRMYSNCILNDLELQRKKWKQCL